MAKDYSKSSSTGRPAVRQVKGPGMNEGLKKPRKKPGQPKNYGKPKSAKATMATGPAFTDSYLPDMRGWGGKKSKP